VRVNDFSLKNKFVIVSLFAFVIIGVLVFFITQTQLQNFLLTETENDFQAVVQEKAFSNFNLELPLSLKTNGNVEKFTQAVKDQTGAQNIKIYDPNGNLVASPVKTEVGQNFSDQKNIKEAIGGTLGTSDLNYNTLTMNIYVPIKAVGGDVRGVLAANIKMTEEMRFVRTVTLQLVGIIGVISFAFGLSIYFIFANAEADMIEKDHSLVDRSKAFEEEKQLDDAIMASIAESLAVINKDGQIMVFNPETERLTGYKQSEVEFRLYRKVLTFFDKEGKEISKNPITETLKTGKATQVSLKEGYYLKNHEKELTPVSISVAPILNEEKNIQGVAVTIQDISTVKELDAIKDEFVYVVAHELGNPIFALDGYLSILQDQDKKYDKETKDIINSARSVNSQLSELVNDLLEVTRNEQGTLKFDLAPLDITQLTELVVKNAQFKAKTKKITIDYQKSRVPKVKANEQKIKEVLTNFVDNAIKYTPNGGKVTITHKLVDGEVVTTVKDTGYGIKKEDQEKLFSKFYRVKTKDTANISGTGLGLFICRQIVEKCGGKVWAESDEGKGSTFAFSLKTTK
jgi:PAS domain S-box-containing protein